MVGNGVERRKSKRHPVAKGKLFFNSHGSKHMVAVTNISEDGLNFVYFSDCCNTPECNQIDIMKPTGNYFCVADVCCRIVYDIPTLSEGLSFSGLPTRTAGVVFSELTEAQQVKISSLIQSL